MKRKLSLISRNSFNLVMVLSLLILLLLLNACNRIESQEALTVQQTQTASSISTHDNDLAFLPLVTPFPTRPVYSPGELVDYIAQPGDSLPVLAQRFNTTVSKIQEENSFIPEGATTMPAGMPMKIPIYYLPLWGPAYKIIPDSLFINGPAQVGFNIAEFIAGFPGWLKNYRAYASGENRSGAEIIDLVARNYSVSPRLLLAMLEYQTEALSKPELAAELQEYPLGYRMYDHKGLYLQLNWAANFLNNGYYSWRQGKLLEMVLQNGRLERFDPWSNAATVALHQYFDYLYADPDYSRSIAHDGFAQTYRQLFGDPWINEQAHLPGSLVQPEFILPIEQGQTWAFTGGPHSAWGIGEPLAALDFAPPMLVQKCETAADWTVAVASGIVVRSEEGQVMIDLDNDGDERTGWNVFYLHVATEERVPLGTQVQRGDPIGHPSCEGGHSTGAHVHIARKYNGEWIPAEGVLAFNLEGWLTYNGSAEYQGTLQRGLQTITANVNSDAGSFIRSEQR
jgi:LasA protease